MALNEQMKEAIQADIADESSRKERLAKQIEGLKSTGKFIGETAVESVPGVSEAIAAKNVSRDLEEGDYVGAGIETLAGLAGLAPAGGDLVAKGLRKFNKTRKAYKLFVKGEDGELYPLFVDANKPVKQGEFLEANFPDVAFKGKRKEGSQESFYVPTKGAKRSKGEKAKGTGDSIIIPDEATRKKLIKEGFITDKTKRTKEAPFGRVTAVAARPGWHASQAPVATHLGPQDLKISKKEADKLVESGITPEAIKRRGDQYYVKRRAEDQVFAEVDMADDIDYQSMLAKEGKSDINDRVPKGGSYRYSDGQADSDQWVVGGDMKVNRVLSREETRAIQKEMGVTDLPYRDEVEAILGKKFAEGGVVMDDYVVAKMMDNETPQKFAEGGMPKQMEMFEDGGLMQEGGTVDPVSGNDVPVGSTQEEVRDDIPAQLSEGEFVFPADVVRYFGLETLMKMRQEAKAGLQMMEDMGQMGNSEEAVIPDDIPFDVNDLDMEDDGVVEYAQGGVVKAQAGTFVQPQGFTGIGGYQASQFGGYQPQYTPYTPPTMPTGQTMAQQYSPVQQQAVPTISQQAPTFTSLTGIAAPSPGGYDETKTYVNDAGMEMQIPFKDGNPIYPIPEGFKLKTEAVQTTKTTTTADTGVDTARPSDSDEDEPKGPQYSTTDVTGLGYDRAKIENEDLLAVLNEVGFDQISDIPIGPSGMLQKGLEQKGIGFTSGKTSGAVFGGVMDVFRGMEGNKFAEMALHEFSDSQKQSLADTYKEVSEQMKDIYTEVDEDGKEKFKSAEEIKSSLASKLSSYGLDPKDFRSVAAMERAVATEIAKDVGGEVREAAKQQAAAYGVETKGKSVSQIREEVEQKKKEALERAKSEAAARARRQQYESDGGGDDTVSQQASQAYGSTGQDRSASSAASYSGRGATGEFGMAKGGLAKQMEKSGLTPKK